jgi:hypothetical protein
MTHPRSEHRVDGPLDSDELVAIDAWWHAANYLTGGQIYLSANHCRVSHYSPNTSSFGRWDISGSVPGLNLECLNDAVAVGDDATGVACRRSSWKRAERYEEVAL